MTAALLFDFGGTLDADGLTWKARLFRLCCDAGVVTTAARFDPLFYAVDDALVGAIPPTLSFEDTVLRLAAGLARGLGVADDAVGARIARRFLEDARRTVDRNAPLLARLSRRYRLGIVSNFYGNLATVCHNSGIAPFFSVIVDSARIGWAKPDPRIFQSALDTLNVTAADAWFVGDSLARDMAGARGIGMRHIWLAGAAARHGTSCCPGDPIVHSLEDVEGLPL